MVPLSAKNKTNMEELKQRILEAVSLKQVSEDQTLVTNLRHYESLQETSKALDDVLAGIANSITNDLLALDIRTALHHMGEITGEITTDDLLENIFSKILHRYVMQFIMPLDLNRRGLHGFQVSFERPFLAQAV